MSCLRRPGSPVRIVGMVRTPRDRTCAESFERYRCAAFGIEVMLAAIVADPVKSGSIDARAWFATVPEVYRHAIVRLVDAVFLLHRDHKLDADGLRDFVRDLHHRIWADLVPVRGL